MAAASAAESSVKATPSTATADPHPAVSPFNAEEASIRTDSSETEGDVEIISDAAIFVASLPSPTPQPLAEPAPADADAAESAVAAQGSFSPTGDAKTAAALQAVVAELGDALKDVDPSSSPNDALKTPSGIATEIAQVKLEAPAAMAGAPTRSSETAISTVAKPSAPAPIVQALAAAQIPAAEVQMTAATTASRPVLNALANAAAAAIAVELSGQDSASDQTASNGMLSPTLPQALQAAPPLKPSRHELGQQTTNAPAPTTSVDTSPAPIQIVSLADADTASSSKQAPTAETTAIIASPEMAVDSSAASSAAAPTDTQSAQQAVAPDRSVGLSTLSRATVETTAQLAAQIARKLEGRSTRFDMVLTPEDLGRVDVSLEIGKDGQLSARLAFDNPAAAADLKGRADELRRQLQEAGFQVAGDALDFSQRDPSAGDGGAFERQQQRNALFAGGSRLAAQADMPIVPAPVAWIKHSQTPDRVDLKV